MNARIAAALLLSLSLTGCESMNWAGPEDFLTSRSVSAPAADAVTVCRAYNCAIRTRMAVTKQDRRALAALFKSAKTPSQERAAVARAVARMERLAGARLGTAGDKGLLYPKGAGDPGQQDCVDEAATTTSYLMMLEANGYLRHHRVKAPSIRGFFLDGRWQHYTAVIAERESGADFAVDSWPRDNGAPPVIAPLAAWKATGEPIPPGAAAL